MKKKTTAIIQAQPRRMSVSAPIQDLGYEKDFYKWTRAQASALKKHDIESLDFENLIEEIESLGKSDKRSLRSQFVVLLMHLLKTKYQPKKKTASWDESIRNAKLEIELILEDSPSLKRFLHGVIENAYNLAVRKASVETGLAENTFPDKCPWTKDELFPFLKKKK